MKRKLTAAWLLIILSFFFVLSAGSAQELGEPTETPVPPGLVEGYMSPDSFGPGRYHPEPENAAPVEVETGAEEIPEASPEEDAPADVIVRDRPEEGEAAEPAQPVDPQDILVPGLSDVVQWPPYADEEDVPADQPPAEPTAAPTEIPTEIPFVMVTEEPEPVHTAVVPTAVPTEQPKAGFLSKHGSKILIVVCVLAVVGAGAAALTLFGKKKPKVGGDDGDIGKKNPGTTAVIKKNGVYLASGCIGQGKRDYQEDAMWICDESRPGMPFCAVIADGMGGMENGAESSARAIGKIKLGYPQIKPDEDIPSKLWELANAVNNEVYTVNSMKGMNGGCTLICVYLFRNELYWISVGDSRIYLIRDGMMASITEEHELENRLYGQLLDDKIDLSDIRNVQERELRKLTSNIGRESIPLIDQNFIPYKLQKGDKILLCSDGISGTLSEEEILECCRGANPDVNSDRLAEAVENRNKRGQDNYSAIVIYCATEDGQ